MSEFDPTIPVNGTTADADPIRANFVALAIHHKGPTAPSSPELGYIWWDDADSGNEKLKCYGGDPAAWRDLFDHMESTPVPSSGGGGGDATVVSGSATLIIGEPEFPPPPDSTWNVWQFRASLAASNMVLNTVGSIFAISDIDTETGPVIADDPSNILSNAVFYDQGSYRGVRVTATGNTGTATVTWTWNSVTFTLTIVSGE